MLLYDLGDATGQPISPYGWRIRESLYLLGIPYEARVLSLTEIHRQFTGVNRTVPVLIDGEVEIGDSLKIAEYLTRNHDPENRLFAGPGGANLASFIADWVDATLMGQVNRMIVKDIHDHLRTEDQSWFRSSQEKKLGAKLEQLEAVRESQRPAFQTSLYPARRAVKSRPFLAGDRPAYGDIVLHSTFQWSRSVSAFQLLRSDDRLNGWIKRMDSWLAAAL